MKSITIHGLDDVLDEKLRSNAQEKGLSLNETIKLLLREALGEGDKPPDRRRDFEDLCGSWSKSDLEEFNRATEELERIDPDE